MARPKGSGGKSSYDKYRKFQSTGHRRKSGASLKLSGGRAGKSSSGKWWSSPSNTWSQKFTKKRSR